MSPKLLRLGMVVLTVCIGILCGSRRTDAACAIGCDGVWYFTQLVANWENSVWRIDDPPCKNFWITDNPDGPLVSGATREVVIWKISADECTLGCQANGGVYGRVYCDDYEDVDENPGVHTCYANCTTMP